MRCGAVNGALPRGAEPPLLRAVRVWVEAGRCLLVLFFNGCCKMLMSSHAVQFFSACLCFLVGIAWRCSHFPLRIQELI